MPRLLLVLALLLGALPATARAASSGPCVPGDAGSPACRWWNAKVTLVADGDTIEVTSPGQGSRQVRFIGINAMELRRYSHTASKRRGDCGGVPAANFVDRLVRASRGRVRLAAQQASSRSGRRLRRSVWVRSGGGWIDVARAELAAGHVLFLPNGDEYAHNLEYQQLAAQARAAGANLWNPSRCHGPDPAARISLAVNWDADGNDAGNLNGEYIELRNDGTAPLDLAGWWVRDSWLNWHGGRKHGIPGFRLPAGTAIAPGDHFRVHIGCGADDAHDIHWCQPTSAFENATYDATHLGDGGYLFDPKGDLRASFLYPCVTVCADPLAGRVKLTPVPVSDSIAVVNQTLQPIDLHDHVIKLRNHGQAGEYVYGHVFGVGSLIKGLGSFGFVSEVGSGLSDNGGVVELRTLDDQLTDCAAWGFGRC